MFNIGGWLGILGGLWVMGSWAWGAYQRGSYAVLVVALVLSVPVALYTMRLGAGIAVFVWRVLNLTGLAIVTALQRVLPGAGQHHDKRDE